MLQVNPNDDLGQLGRSAPQLPQAPRVQANQLQPAYKNPVKQLKRTMQGSTFNQQSRQVGVSAMPINAPAIREQAMQTRFERSLPWSVEAARKSIGADVPTEQTFNKLAPKQVAIPQYNKDFKPVERNPLKRFFGSF